MTYVCLVHIVCPSFFVFWSLYIGMPCTYCLSFVLCLLTIVHRHALYIRTNNMYKAYLCTMIRRQRTKDKQYVQGIPMYNGQKIKNEGQTICTRHTYVQWIGMPCTYCLSFVLCLLIIVHRHALYILFVLRSLGMPMYNDQKAKNEGQTICTRHTYVQWSEDKERRTNNMYKAYLCTMVRR
jgi:hypothetical protein